MKFSSALALGAAPMVLAKAAHNVYPVKRNEGVMANSVQLSSNPNALEKLLGLGMSGVGLSKEKASALKTDIIVIWVNQGGGAATTQINRQETVTVTKTVTDGGAAPPGATPPPANGGAAAPPPPNVVVPPGAATTHNVTVGGPKGLIFEPNEIKAKVGDMVVFKFLSQNHTVTQSAFETPCDPLAGGMDSGFQANANNTVNPPPLVAMQVMVETPLWFYCRAAQGAHCGKGMVFSINPTAAKTHSEFAVKAIASKGLGTGGAITGNSPAGGAAAPPAANPAAPAASGSASLVPLPPTGGAAAPGAPTVGQGKLNPDGSCQCVVTCAAGSFPAMGAQGINNFGGMPGSIPANMLGM